MWKKKPKYKEIDETLVNTIKYGLPGIHVKDLIPVDHIYANSILVDLCQINVNPN